jgi:hypothetical protein
MIAISVYRTGRCQSCKEQNAEYSITGEEWGGAREVCQGCMLALLNDDPKLRAVLLLQAATHATNTAWLAKS